jgi:hypothetical protein
MGGRIFTSIESRQSTKSWQRQLAAISAKNAFHVPSIVSCGTSDRNRHRHTCRLAQQQSEPFPNANKNLVTARIKGENGELMLDHEGKKMRQPKGNVAAIVAAWAKNDSTAARQVELKVLDRMFRLET